MKNSPRRSRNAFTLMEILTALGLFAFAAAGLLALFPIAQFTERESEEETRATLIASGIMESLALPSADGSIPLEVGISKTTPVWKTLNSTVRTNQSVAYNSSCEPLRLLGEEETLAPISDQETAAVATLKLAPKSSTPGITTAEVEVAFPASAPASKRTVHRFVRLLDVH